MPGTDVRPRWQLRTVPPETVPTIPDDHEIILYIHGGPGSRLEESIDLVPELHAAGLARGKKYTVIAFDHPNNGYSGTFDHTDIAPDEATRFDAVAGTPTYPILDWLEGFIIAFIDRLEAIVPIKHRLAAIVGGSLGGCLTLRLGRRVDQPWIRRIVAWDPASAWTSWSNDIAKFVALDSGRSRWRVDPPPTPEATSRRPGFFAATFGTAWPFSTVTYPQMWYRDSWPWKAEYIAATLRDQQEVYNRFYRRWHWRVGTELLLFSHRNTDTPDRRPRCESILVPTLLAAGKLDDYDASIGFHWLNVYARTRELAALMRNTPGTSAFLLETGHSIHNERPRYLAGRIVDFILTPTARLHAPLALTPETMPPDEDSGLDRASPIDAGCGGAMAPPALLASAPDAGRLVLWLRDAAARRDPVDALVRAATMLYFATHPRIIDGIPATVEGANALADLAVTGRAAFAGFRAAPPSEADLVAAVRGRVGIVEDPVEARVVESVRAVLSRAYNVAWALRDPDPSRRQRTRAPLGWIAVSGEDDLPHRPVNAPSALFPQLTVPVTHRGVTVDVRFMIASVEG